MLRSMPTLMVIFVVLLADLAIMPIAVCQAAVPPTHTRARGLDVTASVFAAKSTIPIAQIPSQMGKPHSNSSGGVR
jgi:hypothetical protein